MKLIQETYAITGDNTDVLAAPSRLAAIPYNGVLRLAISATVSNASNLMNLTVQLPDGETPVNAQVIPANGYTTVDDIIHASTVLTYNFTASQGGHYRVEIAETGTCSVFLVASLSPR